ncbi:hypothetical protein MRX96_047969 [Rhipicephalus microplus]
MGLRNTEARKRLLLLLPPRKEPREIEERVESEGTPVERGSKETVAILLYGVGRAIEIRERTKIWGNACILSKSQCEWERGALYLTCAEASATEDEVSCGFVLDPRRHASSCTRLEERNTVLVVIGSMTMWVPEERERDFLK